MEFSELIRPLVGARYQPPFGCFQLVREYLHRAGLAEVPDYAETVSEHEKAAALLELLPRWAEQVQASKPGDLILLSFGGLPAHVGIMVNDGEMLHSMDGHDAAIERITGHKWRRRIIGYWRIRRSGDCDSEPAQAVGDDHRRG